MTVEEARALGFGAEGSDSTSTGAGDSEVPTGDDPVPEVEGDEPLLEEVPAEGAAPAAEVEAEPDEEATQSPKKGPPKTVPYDRLSESRAELRAERARRMALEEQLASGAPAPQKEPRAPLTEEQQFFRDAVVGDIDAARAENAEVREYIREQKDKETSAAFWNQHADVDEAVQDAVEADWAEAKALAKRSGQALNFNRLHILLLKEGEASLQAKAAARGEASKTRQAAEVQKRTVATVNRNARGVTTGNTVGRPGAKAFKDMTVAEQEKALADVII
jgi:hypothetical protein